MEQYRFLMIGAHPDDMELRCGGLALRLREKGHRVMFLSMTDGGAGHQSMKREDLIERRRKEAEAVARFFDIEYRILPFPDARLEPSLEARDALVKCIREYAPHVIFTHRTADYHPDHRACGQLVMDCSYLVNVPLYCPDVPCPPLTPVIMSVWDHFMRPVPFKPDLLIPIDDQVERKIEGSLLHFSQFYEWLPEIDGWKDVIAAPTIEEKTARLKERLYMRFANDVAMYPDMVPEGVKYAETFEWNEYGAPLTDELRHALCGE